MARRTAMAFRLSDAAENLIQLMAEQYGVSQTAILELAIREKAKREKVQSKEVAGQRQSDAA